MVLRRPLILLLLATLLAITGWLAFGARGAAAQQQPPPAAVYVCTPGPTDCSGWRNTPSVWVNWSVALPPAVTGTRGSCGPVIEVKNEGQWSFTCWTVNNTSPTAVPATATVHLDKTAP